MTRAFIRDLSALLLVCLGLGATIAAGGLDPRTIAFAVATVLAWGTSGSWGPGLMALLAGIGAHPLDLQPIFPTGPVITAVFAGVGLGLVIRYLAAQGWHGPLRRETALSVILLGLGLLFLFQPSMVHLADATGAPAYFRLDVVDPTTLLSTVVVRHLPVALPHPLAPFLPILATLLFVASWAGFARVGSNQMRFRFTTFVGIATALALLAAITLPLLGTVSLDAEQLRQQLSLRAGANGAIAALTLPELSLAPWSRPPLDALRLVLCLGAVSLNFSRGRPFQPPGARPSIDVVVVALAALIVAFGLQAMMPEAMAGTAIVLLTAIVAGRAGREPGASTAGHGIVRAPHVAFMLALFLLLTTISLAPLGP